MLPRIFAVDFSLPITAYKRQIGTLLHGWPAFSEEKCPRTGDLVLGDWSLVRADLVGVFVDVLEGVLAGVLVEMSSICERNCSGLTSALLRYWIKPSLVLSFELRLVRMLFFILSDKPTNVCFSIKIKF